MTAFYRDARCSIEDRVADLLRLMTLEEKAAQLTAVWLNLEHVTQLAPTDDVARTDLTAIDAQLKYGIGYVARPYGSEAVDPQVGIERVNALQRRLVEGTRLGIPAICHEECLSGLMALDATSFPSPLNLASMWDPDAVESMAEVIRRQMGLLGVHQALAPVADVARDARWGRVEETFGEDPYLVGTLATAFVRGVQGTPSDRTIATLKHFAGYSFSEGGRNVAPVHLGRRELLDTFALPFEMAVRDGGALGVMAAYVATDNVPAHADPFLLTDLLRKRWGFEGIVVADYLGLTNLYKQDGLATDRATAVALALNAGLDVELPFPLEMTEGVPEAVDRGLLEMNTVDQAVARTLALKFRIGLFDQPYVESIHTGLSIPSDDALARTLTVRSLTLLANDGTLPLSDEQRSIAVIGPNADDVFALFGNYSFESHVLARHGQADRVTVKSVLEALRDRFGDRITYTEGVPTTGGDTDGIDKAVALAAANDAVVLVLGDRSSPFGEGTVGEGSDTPDLSLPGKQPDLLRAVLATGTPVILVLLSGRPYELGAAAGCAAVLEAWFPGRHGAAAIVDVTTGVAEPGGRSPVTFSQGAGLQPRYYNHLSTAPGLPIEGFDAVYPFGHGMSYTTFGYSDLVVDAEVPIDGTIRITCAVENSGHRFGEEVVQFYVRDHDASVMRPVRQLVGFKRVGLAPGSTTKITCDVPVDMISYTGMDYSQIVEPGRLEVMVGSSSEDIRLQCECTLVGARRQVATDRALRSSCEVHAI